MLGFFYFLILLFMIPAFAVSVYALLIYKLVSRLGRIRYFVPPILAILLSALPPYFSEFPVEYASILGTALLLVVSTEMALGIVTPIFIFEKRLNERQRVYLILFFSILLALIFMRNFASVMSISTPAMGLLGLIDYREVLKFGKVIYHFISTLLIYLEVTIISALFYAFCYGLITLLKGEKAEELD